MLAVVTSLCRSAFVLRRSLVPECDGPLALLADAVVFLALLFFLLQVLGSVGWLRRVPITGACLATTLAIEAWARRTAHIRFTGIRSGRTRRRSNRVASRWTVFASGVAIAVAVAPWVLRTWIALHSGITGRDSLYYHLPFAAGFAQSGSTTGLHFVGFLDEAPYDPQNSELVHALSMVMFQRDLLSPVINLVWFGLAGLASWCVGRARSAAPATLAAVALVLAGPLFMAYDAGQATNDVVDIALLLTVVAIVLNSEGRVSVLGLAAAAAGLGLSNKLSLVVPIAALTLAVAVWTPRRQLWRVSRVWFPCMALTGAYWYLRDLVLTGSPVPSVRLGIGAVALPHVVLPHPPSVAHYFFQVYVWRSVFLPGLDTAFGAIWPLTIGLSAAGMILAACARDRLLRSLGIATLACVVGYVFTPETAGGPFIFIFRVNVRFLFPSLMLGLVLLPLTPLLQTRRRQALVTTALAAAVVATEASYAHELRPRLALFVLVAAACAVAGAAFAAWSKPSLRSRRTAVFTATALVVLVVWAGWAVQQDYFANRYRQGVQSLNPISRSLGGLYTWADHVSETRIGFAGFPEGYPLYGSDLSNRVQSVAIRGAHGQFRFAANCTEWRSAVNAGHYDYVAIGPSGFQKQEPTAAKWTRSDPAAQTVVTSAQSTVFRITGPLHANTCSRTTDGTSP